MSSELQQIIIALGERWLRRGGSMAVIRQEYRRTLMLPELIVDYNKQLATGGNEVKNA